MGLTDEERQARVRQIQAAKAKEAAERQAVKRRIAEDNVRVRCQTPYARCVWS